MHESQSVLKTGQKSLSANLLMAVYSQCTDTEYILHSKQTANCLGQGLHICV